MYDDIQNKDYNDTFNNLSPYPLSNEDINQIMLEKMYDGNKLLIDHKSLKPHQTRIDKQPLILQLPSESEQNINSVENIYKKKHEALQELNVPKITIPQISFNVEDDKNGKKKNLRFFLLIIIILICVKSIYNIICYVPSFDELSNMSNNQH